MTVYFGGKVKAWHIKARPGGGGGGIQMIGALDVGLRQYDFHLSMSHHLCIHTHVSFSYFSDPTFSFTSRKLLRILRKP